jgi:hypothetical protein
MTWKYSIFIFTAALLFSLPLTAEQIIDRIVATVNGHIILQSDWDDAARCESIMNGHAQEQLMPKARKEVLDRMIDQELLREQIPPQQNSVANSKDVQQRLEEIKNFYNSAGDNQAWTRILARYQVTEEQIKSRIVLQMQLMQVVNSHLRPEVEIDQKSVESYYNQDLLPQLRKAGTQEVPLDKAAPQIKEILTQQKMNRLLVAWLQNLRAGSKIATSPLDTGEQSQ